MKYNLFWNSYYKYLEIKDNEKICLRKRKEIINNKFHYPIIISFIDNRVIYSVEKNYYENFIKDININSMINKEEIKNYIKIFLQNKIQHFRIKEMYRMYKKESKNDIDISKVISINNQQKKEYFNSFKIIRDDVYKEKKWKEISKNNFLNGIIKDNKIVSMGYISDINYGMGNIVIQTIEEYQNRGYGKMVVEKISQEALKNGVLPIYWVENKNIASIKLAESLGFKKVVDEIVVSRE